MKTINLLCSYYYVGLVIGYVNKQEIIKWADSVIERGDFPLELIDVSLSGKKSIEDVASMLKKACNEYVIVEPLYKLIGDIVLEYEEGQISDEHFFNYLRSLHVQGNAFGIDEDLSHKLGRLDDAYYLATEGIYGFIEDVQREALKDLKCYKEYIGYFDEV